MRLIRLLNAFSNEYNHFMFFTLCPDTFARHLYLFIQLNTYKDYILDYVVLYAHEALIYFKVPVFFLARFSLSLSRVCASVKMGYNQGWELKLK